MHVLNLARKQLDRVLPFFEKFNFEKREKNNKGVVHKVPNVIICKFYKFTDKNQIFVFSVVDVVLKTKKEKFYLLVTVNVWVP